MSLELLIPSLDLLPAYADALERGWSPDNMRPIDTPREHLAAIAQDAAGFVGGLDDPEARAGPVPLPDGTFAVRLPGYHRWLWDGAFCGSIGFRWRLGTAELPPHVLGHIGFSVIPWKRRRGYATQALKLLLPDARARGLDYVELTTDLDNTASQRVITANGGRLVDRFLKPEAFGGAEGLRFRIEL